MKTFYYLRDTVKKIKRQVTDWVKYIQNIYLIRLVLKFYKEHLFLNRKTRKKQFKNGQCI